MTTSCGTANGTSQSSSAFDFFSGMTLRPPFSRNRKSSLIPAGGGSDAQMNGVTGFAGSARASSIFGKAAGGSDSVEIITVGDSNTGFSESGSYGYATGIYEAFKLNAVEYATGIFPTGVGVYGGEITGGIAGTGVTVQWIAATQSNAYDSTKPIKTLINAATGASPNQIAKAVTDYLGMDTSTLLPQMVADTQSFQGTFIDSGVTYTSYANYNTIIIASTSALYASGQSLQYRLVHAKVPTVGGVFTLGYTTGSFANQFDPLPQPTASSTGTFIDSYPWNFTSPSVSGSSLLWRVSFDGMSQGSVYYPTGPLATIAHSIVRRNTKGFSHTNLLREPGRTTKQLADRIEAMDKLLDVYLREIIQRQVSCNCGTGNAVVVIMSGINYNSETGGCDSEQTYTTNCQRIIDRIKSRWVTVGGSPDKLAFVLLPTHPITSAINNWDTKRASVISASNAWARSQPGVCVFDINAHYTASQILANGWYSTTGAGQAHLKNAGYSAIATQLVQNLLPAVP